MTITKIVDGTFVPITERDRKDITDMLLSGERVEDVGGLYGRSGGWIAAIAAECGLEFIREGGERRGYWQRRDLSKPLGTPDLSVVSEQQAVEIDREWREAIDLLRLANKRIGELSAENEKLHAEVKTLMAKLADACNRLAEYDNRAKAAQTLASFQALREATEDLRAKLAQPQSS